MSKFYKTNYDDFVLKLKQKSTIEPLKNYILWQRMVRNNKKNGNTENTCNLLIGPVSINIDITVNCNFSCSHCVDSKILNTGDRFTLDELFSIIKVLSSNGLKSIILIGGGEPVLHPQFESIVRFIKSLRLQLAIVTNGSNISKLINVADCLTEKDWIRFSLDSGTDKTFQLIHNPKNKVKLLEICTGAKRIKEINEKVSIGYSYIIFYEDCNTNGNKLIENVDEIPMAVELAIQSRFDYISFKPCLIKTDSTYNRETLLYNETENRIKIITNKIKQRLFEAKKLSYGRINCIESVNLRAMFANELDQYKTQPQNCHSQIFRQIVTPSGIYHCPAYRGDLKSLITSTDGYISQQKYEETVGKNIEHLFRFDASKECKDIVCFYNRINWWIEDYINSGEDVAAIKAVQDKNLFL